MIPTLHTERLTLRPLVIEDAPAIYEIFSDPEAMRYLPARPNASLEQTIAGLTMRLSREGGINWALCLKGDDTALGIVQYLGQTRFPEMGYIIHRTYWGRGLVVEGCQAALDYGFRDLGYERVEFWIDERNAASIRVAEKLGFGVKGRVPSKFPHQEDFQFMLVYGKQAHEWLGTPAPTRPRMFGMVPTLMVPDVGTAVDFYRNMLGFELEWMHNEPIQRAVVSAGEWSGNLAAFELRLTPDGIPSTGGFTLFMDTQLDDWAETLRGRGVEMLEVPHETDMGTREFAIRDCNGVVLRFSARR